MKENFSLDSLDPMNKLKEFGKRILIWVIEVVVIGVACLFVMNKCGLMDEANFKTYATYFLACSALLYILTFSYFAYKCKSGKLDYGKLAKVSLLGPSVVALHVIILIASMFIVDVPEIGLIIYGLLWSSLGVIGVSGIAFASGLTIAEATYKC